MSIAIGGPAPPGVPGIAIGAFPGGPPSVPGIAIGYNAGGIGATAGWGGITHPDNSIFIGAGAGTSTPGVLPNTNNVVVGAHSDANGSCNIIFGCHNKVTGNNNYVVGNYVEITGNKICFIQNEIVPQYRKPLKKYFCEDMEDIIMKFVW